MDEYRKYKRGSNSIISPAPGEECTGTTGRAAEMRATYLQSPRTPYSSPPLSRLGQPSTQPIPCPGIELTASEENALELVALRETLQPGAGGARPGGSRGCTEHALPARCARIALIITGYSMQAMIRTTR